MFKLLKEFLSTGIAAHKISIEASEISKKALELHIEVGERNKSVIAKQSERADVEIKIAKNEALLQTLSRIQMKENLKATIATMKGKKRKFSTEELEDIQKYEEVLKSMVIE